MHFTKDELKCKCGCELYNIHQELIYKLEEIRVDYSRPMVINSGSRCIKYNTAVKGAIHSPHLKGWAVDIRISSSNQRYELMMIALTKGIRRIGVADNFIHIDIAPLPEWGQDVIWMY